MVTQEDVKRFGDFEVINSDCPSAKFHTPQPKGYGAFFSWCAHMVRQGYKQSRCPDCKRYVVWSK